MKVISREKREIYEFGGFRFDLDERTIERVDGPSVDALPEKTLQILALLVRRRGHLVAKDEILEQIWPDSFVEENNVEKRVSCLRQFLGKSENGGKFIETVRGHGYRFVGHVKVVEVSGAWLPETLRSPAAPQDDAPDLEFVAAIEHTPANGSGTMSDLGVRKIGRGGIVRLSVFFLLLAAGTVAAYLSYAWKTASSGGGTRSIAVLPFRPVNTANRDENYEIGIADALINRLSSTDGLIVRQLSAVRRYADLEMDPVAAGHEQKVDYVLAPYYQMADGKIRITGQLIDLATGKTEQSFDFVKDISGIFAMQDAVADELRNKLAVKFGAGPGGPTTKRGTNNEEAYRLYQLGMTLVARGGQVNKEEAIGYLDKALALDPDYARGWAGKAYAHAQNVWDLRGVPNREQIPKSFDAVQKALSIDPDLSEGHTVLCGNLLFFAYDFDRAETACRRAVELDPNSSVARLGYSRLLSCRGRFDEAFGEAKTAMDFDPASFVIQRQYANALFGLRRYQEAEEQYKRAISLNPKEYGPYDRLIRTLVAQGKEPEAFDCLIRWYEIRKEAPETIEGLKAAYTTSGWRGAVTELIRTIEARTTPNHYALAQWYATLGNKDKAFENLEKAYQERNLNMVLIRFADRHFDSLRDDPRFTEVVRRVDGT
jgi:DNA-binding winged helix-turn-helix (wHTH) protein/tetratricopeptide (TPR) repeat protein